MKLPYNYISEHAFSLIKLMASFDGEEISQMLSDELNDYLAACGWSNSEFDNETIHIIDLNWEQQYN